MTYEVEIEGRTHQVQVTRVEGGWEVKVDDGPSRRVTGGRLGAAEWALRGLGRGRTVGVHVDGEHATLQIDGHPLTATVFDPRRHAFDALAGDGEGEISTPMPGVVARVLVSEGDAVEEGQVLVVVEAMKMENEYRSPVAGAVATVHVEAGQAVESNMLLITVEPA